MKTINLRNYYYPRYKEDVLVEVSDKVAETIIRSVRQAAKEPLTARWDAPASVTVSFSRTRDIRTRRKVRSAEKSKSAAMPLSVLGGFTMTRS